MKKFIMILAIIAAASTIAAWIGGFDEGCVDSKDKDLDLSQDYLGI